MQKWSSCGCCRCISNLPFGIDCMPDCCKDRAENKYTASREQSHAFSFMHVEACIMSAQSEQIESLVISKENLSPFKIKWGNCCGIILCKSLAGVSQL